MADLEKAASAVFNARVQLSVAMREARRFDTEWVMQIYDVDQTLYKLHEDIYHAACEDARDADS